MEKEIIIKLENISKTYTNKKVLDNLSIDFTKNSFNVLVGKSGCGKSTILKIIMGLEKANSGNIENKNKCSIVFQNGALLPWRNVYDNIILSIEKDKEINVKEKDKKVRDMIKVLELDSFEKAYPRDLSGGQRQRVGIARALIGGATVLLLDEPFSALDIETTSRLHKKLLDIWQDKKLTIIMVSHSIDEAVMLADNIFIIKKGKVSNIFEVKETGTREENEYIKNLKLKIVDNLT